MTAPGPDAHATSPVYWIGTRQPGRLAIAAHPPAGDRLESAIAGWKFQDIHRVVSLLEPEEAASLGLAREPSLCRAHGIAFVSFPIPDFGVPTSVPDAAELAGNLSDGIARAQAVMLHCRGGVGRSSLLAACILVVSGHATERAFEMIAAARGVGVPETPAQRDWVAAFEAAIANRR
jgi:protein-tyrosine phosphatase